MTFTRPRKHIPRRRGLALIEVLICSFVAAMMLLATAIAFRASVMAYRDNTERNMLISSARTAMRQLISEIRQADAHGPINDTTVPNAVTLFAAGQTTENSGIQLLKTQPDVDDPTIVKGVSEVVISWQYDVANKQIIRTRSFINIASGSVLSTSTAVMASYVQEFKVRMEPARSAANIASGNTSFDLLLRAVVTMTMQNLDSSGKMILNQGSGLVTERLLDAAVPRKNFAGL